MLLRRLGLTLKSCWAAGSKVSDADRARPLGRITPVATSATLGSRGAPPPCWTSPTPCSGAFREDAVIEEIRLAPRAVAHHHGRGAATASSPQSTQPCPRRSSESRRQNDTADNHDLAAAVFAELFRHRRGAAAHRRRHARPTETPPADRQVLNNAVMRAPLADPPNACFPVISVDRDAARTCAVRTACWNTSLRCCPTFALVIRVDNSWIRGTQPWLTCVWSAAAALPLVDDGTVADKSELFPARRVLPAVAAPGGARGYPTAAPSTLPTGNPRRPRRRGRQVPALISARRTAGEPEGRRAAVVFTLDHHRTAPSPRPESDDVLGRPGAAGTDAGRSRRREQSKRDVCPACEVDDGIRFMGSAVTQLSVTLSNLFGDKDP